ncbi:MAG: thioesterase [Desulfobacterota bacterium]|nr:thioesterase [Thermodesulfobacteriota bacterium]
MESGHEKPQTWEDAYLVSFYEVDAQNRIFLPSLWKYLQETAWNHANRLGIGYEDLARSGCFWILSRLAIDIQEYPAWGDKIRVKTWLMGSSRLFAFRDFSIMKDDGRIIGGAKSAWVVLDIKTRKPQRIEPFLRGLNPHPDQHGGKTPLEKLPAPGHPDEETFFTVRYSDLDLNLHVNNARYIEWILDSYSFEMNQTHQISTLEINFLAESNFGDELIVRTEELKNSPSTFLHSIVRKGDELELCRARVRWKPANPNISEK